MGATVAKRYGGAGGKKGGRRKRSALEAMEPREDHGTPELAAKRLTLVKGGNPADSTTWLDVLLARQVLSVKQHRAGDLYAKLRFRLFGRGVASVESQNAGEMTPELEARLRQQYEAADKALRGAGERARWNTRALVVDNQPPSWVLRPVTSDAAYVSVMAGLDVLAKHFGIR